jgi:hypothetical protein
LRLSAALPKVGGKAIFMMMLIIIVTVIRDTSIPRVAIFTGGLRSQIQNIIYFIVTIFVFAVGQFIVLGYIASRGSEPLKHSLVSVHKIITLAQYVLIVILASIAFEIIFTSIYSSLLLKSVVWINYALSALLLGFLAMRFFVWYRSNKNSVIISYGIAMAMLSFLSLITIIFLTNALSGQAGLEYIRPNINYLLTLSGTAPTLVNPFAFMYFTMTITSFLVTWFSTVLLLRHYSKKVGRIRYWILVSIPLVFFLSQFQTGILNIFTPLRIADPFMFGIVSTLIFNSTKTVGGILFGIAFWTVAKNIARTEVKEYMTISAFGMMLLFTSNQPLGLTFLSYPPFGLATISFFGLASYLILIGVYSSAISVANDIKVRRYIKNSVEQEASLLGNIGTAQMEEQIRKMVLDKTRKLSTEITQETGIQPSLEEQDIREYVVMALDGIKHPRKNNNF